MSLARRSFVAAIFAFGTALTVTGSAFAQTAGSDYTPIVPAQPTENSAKIEVLEFFSYGCPHCADFNPLLAAWVARQPGDVVVKKVPVSFGRAAWANVAKLFYALEITGDQARLEADIFKAIHQERVSLFDDKVMLEWVVKKLRYQTSSSASRTGRFRPSGALRKCSSMACAPSSMSRKRAEPIAMAMGSPMADHIE